jgi:hypothetical protein
MGESIEPTISGQTTSEQPGIEWKKPLDGKPYSETRQFLLLPLIGALCIQAFTPRVASPKLTSPKLNYTTEN